MAASRGTKKLQCECEHDYQDEIYGKGIRLHNAAGTESSPEWRCTVCEKTKVGRSAKSDKKKKEEGSAPAPEEKKKTR